MQLLLLAEPETACGQAGGDASRMVVVAGLTRSAHLIVRGRT